jgi:hypothetical protein
VVEIKGEGVNSSLFFLVLFSLNRCNEMVDIVPIQVDVHSRIKINDSNMAHVSSQQVIPIVFQEFLAAARNYPIVFVKNTDTGRFQSVCVLGIKPGQNKFVKNNKELSSDAYLVKQVAILKNFYNAFLFIFVVIVISLPFYGR